MCARKDWRDLLSDNAFWWKHCVSTFNVGDVAQGVSTEAFDEVDFKPTGDYRYSYAFWHAYFAPFASHLSLVRRVAGLWRKISTWYARHLPERMDLARSEPATQEVLDELCKRVNAPLIELCLIYKFGNGMMPQNAAFGLFGGYQAYDLRVSLTLLRPESITVAAFSFLPIAVSNSEKIVCIDIRNKAVVCLDRSRKPMRICPQGATVIDWMEEFANRLDTGAYGVSPSTGVSLFPATFELGMREQITQGLRVRASAVLLPEVSIASRGMYQFSYSVRFYLLPVEEQAALAADSATTFRPKTCVQLASRHWNILDGDGNLIDEVDGDGVIGEFPILKPGAPEFVYQSCTQVRSNGAMDGYFTFVEGTLQRQTGPYIQAVCPRFDLKCDLDYIF